MSQQVKRLYRPRTDRVIAGVCAGLGDFLGVDPVVVRLAWAIVTLMTGVIPGLLGYVAAWIIVPQETASAAPVSQPGASPSQGRV